MIKHALQYLYMLTPVPPQKKQKKTQLSQRICRLVCFVKLLFKASVREPTAATAGAGAQIQSPPHLDHAIAQT